MDKTKIDLIFEEWSATFRSKNKRWDAIRGNFEELFQSWHDAGATQADLHEVYLPSAIKVHLPSAQTITWSYKQNPYAHKSTEKEFGEKWLKSIKDIATETFFEYFPNEIEPKKQKIYGNLGKAEYDNQRRLSAQFKYLDTTELVKRLDEKNDDMDLEDLKRALFGDNNG